MPRDVQFIAYEINTFPRRLSDGKKEYLGLDDDAADMAARVKLVKRALETAKAKADADPGVLKVFVMPEFFFRGRLGAYGEGRSQGGLDLVTGMNRQTDEQGLEIRPASAGLVGDLRELVKGDEWKDWIVVFGTILVVASKQESSLLEQLWNRIFSTSHGEERNIINYSLVQAGGWGSVADETQREALAKSLVKGNKSWMDFVAKPARGLDAGSTKHFDQPASTENPKLAEELNDPRGVFTLAGVCFSLEVCLDHALGVSIKNLEYLAGVDPTTLSPKDGTRAVAEAVQARKQRLADAQHLVDIHLVTSGGMSLKDGKLCHHGTGAAFLCDGNAVSDLKSTGVRTVTKHPVDGSALAGVTIDQLFQTDAGSVAVYGTVAIDIAS